MEPDSPSPRIAIVCTQWNRELVDCMEEDARCCLYAHGIGHDHIEAVRVAGAFELPQAALALAQAHGARRPPHAIIALGVVIRGETPHFQFVADACARGLGQVALNHSLPVAFGVLTTDNREQAERRAAFARHEPKTPLADHAWGGRPPARRRLLELHRHMRYEDYARCGGLPDTAGRKSKGWEAAEAVLSLLEPERSGAAAAFPR